MTHQSRNSDRAACKSGYSQLSLIKSYFLAWQGTSLSDFALLSALLPEFKGFKIICHHLIAPGVWMVSVFDEPQVISGLASLFFQSPGPRHYMFLVIWGLA